MNEDKNIRIEGNCSVAGTRFSFEIYDYTPELQS